FWSIWEAFLCLVRSNEMPHLSWWVVMQCLLLLGCGAAAWYGYRSRWLRKQLVQRQGYMLNLYKRNCIETFIEYLFKNPAMSSLPDVVEHGDPHLLAQAFAQASASYASNSNNGHYSPSDFNARS